MVLTAWLRDPAGTDLTSGRGSLVVPLGIGLGWAVLTLVRLARGRLRLWTLTADDEGLRCRGWRTDRLVPWDRVRSVALRRRTHLVVRARGSAEPVELSTLCFDVPPGQLVELVERGRARHGRRRGPGRDLRSGRGAR